MAWESGVAFTLMDGSSFCSICWWLVGGKELTKDHKCRGFFISCLMMFNMLHDSA